MSVEPHCVAKRLSEAEPGELLRYRRSEQVVRSILALADDEGQPRRVVVFLDSFGEQPRAPWLQIVPLGDDPIVLSFGRKYSFRFDAVAARVASDEGSGYHPVGALLIRETGSVLRVNPGPRMADRVFDFDTSTGSVQPCTPGAKQIAILDWELRLDVAHDDRPIFFTFKAP